MHSLSGDYNSLLIKCKWGICEHAGTINITSYITFLSLIVLILARGDLLLLWMAVSVFVEFIVDLICAHKKNNFNNLYKLILKF